MKNATNKMTVMIPDGAKLPDRDQRKPIKPANRINITSSATGFDGSCEVK